MPASRLALGFPLLQRRRRRRQRSSPEGKDRNSAQRPLSLSSLPPSKPVFLDCSPHPRKPVLRCCLYHRPESTAPRCHRTSYALATTPRSPSLGSTPSFSMLFMSLASAASSSGISYRQPRVSWTGEKAFTLTNSRTCRSSVYQLYQR